MTADLDEDEILEVLRVLDESNFDELCLETESMKLVAKKSGGAETGPELSVRRTAGDSSKTVAHEKRVFLADPKENPGAEPSPVPPEDGLVPVKAPVLGIFYTSPRPGEPPYVREGTSVGESDTVCLIEVMKVFNSVPAGVRGVVAKVCVANGQMVEFGQTLFLIRPAGNQEGELGS